MAKAPTPKTPSPQRPEPTVESIMAGYLALVAQVSRLAGPVSALAELKTRKDADSLDRTERKTLLRDMANQQVRIGLDLSQMEADIEALRADCIEPRGLAR